MAKCQLGCFFCFALFLSLKDEVTKAEVRSGSQELHRLPKPEGVSIWTPPAILRAAFYQNLSLNCTYLCDSYAWRILIRQSVMVGIMGCLYLFLSFCLAVLPHSHDNILKLKYLKYKNKMKFVFRISEFKRLT